MCSEQSEFERDAILVTQAQEARRQESEARQRYDRAFQTLKTTYEKQLERYCARILGSNEGGRDAAQEAFIRADQKIHTLRSGQAFRNWLFLLAARLCYNRNAAIKNLRQPSLDDTESGLRETQAAPENMEDQALDAVVVEDIQRRAEAELDSLDCNIIKVILEKDITSAAGIGRELEVAPSTIQHRLKRLQRWLQQFL